MSITHRAGVAVEAQPAYTPMERRLGDVPNVLKALSPAPELLADVAALMSDLDSCRLSPELRALVGFRVSVNHGCPYAIHHYGLAAREAGVAALKLEDLKRDDFASLVPVERKVLEFSDQVSGAGASVDRSLVAELRRWLGSQQFSELCVTIGTAALMVSLSQGLQPSLEANAL